MFIIDNERMIMLFRAESETYERPYPDQTEIDSTKVELTIANELREQINNGKNKSIYSLTKFLSVALFKYNKNGYDDVILALIPNIAFNSILLYAKENKVSYFLPCVLKDDKLLIDSIDDTSPFADDSLSKAIPADNYIIENYLIDVCKDHAELDYYLWRITGNGKKKFAACKNDGEVLARNIVEGDSNLIKKKYMITNGEVIDFVYVLFALYYNEYIFYQDLVECLFRINPNLKNRYDYNTLFLAQKYLSSYIDIEQCYCSELIQSKVEEFFNQDEITQWSYSDGYQFAMKILKTESLNDVFKMFCDSDIYNVPANYEYRNPLIATLLSLLFKGFD